MEFFTENEDQNLEWFLRPAAYNSVDKLLLATEPSLNQRFACSIPVRNASVIGINVGWPEKIETADSVTTFKPLAADISRL